MHTLTHTMCEWPPDSTKAWWGSELLTGCRPDTSTGIQLLSAGYFTEPTRAQRDTHTNTITHTCPHTHKHRHTHTDKRGTHDTHTGTHTHTSTHVQTHKHRNKHVNLSITSRKCFTIFFYWLLMWGLRCSAQCSSIVEMYLLVLCKSYAIFSINVHTKLLLN